MLKPLKRIRDIVLDVIGAGGASGWSSGTLIVSILSLTLSVYVLPAFAFAVAVWAGIEYYRKINNLPPLFPNGLKFLLNIFGAAGATHFTLTWITLVAIAAGATSFAFPPLLLLLVPIAVGVISMWVVYGKHEPGSYGAKAQAIAKKIHEVITQVFGAGGAIFWFLGCLAVALSIVFPPLVLVTVPIVFVALAAIWYAANPKVSEGGYEPVPQFDHVSDGTSDKEKAKLSMSTSVSTSPTKVIDSNTSNTSSTTASCWDGWKNYFSTCSFSFPSCNFLSVSAASSSDLKKDD